MEAGCKSRDKACRACGKPGHYSEIHDVKDIFLKQRISQFLGFDVYGQGAVFPGPTSSSFAPPPTNAPTIKNEYNRKLTGANCEPLMSVNTRPPKQPASAPFNDWYAN